MLGWPLPLAALAQWRWRRRAALVGLPTLRLRGLYFAMATLAAAEMLRILFGLVSLSAGRSFSLASLERTKTNRPGCEFALVGPQLHQFVRPAAGSRR